MAALAALVLTLVGAERAIDAEANARLQASSAEAAEEDALDAAARLAELRTRLENAEVGHRNLFARAKKNERRIALLEEEIARLEAAAAAQQSSGGGSGAPTSFPPRPSPTFVCDFDYQGNPINCRIEHGD